MKLHYTTYGAPGHDPILFLHGMGGTGKIWRPITAQLEANYYCIAPDQRGHGGSFPVPPSISDSFGALDYAHDIIELLNDLELETCYVVGHSMGVRTALALSHLAPERVKKLVAIDIGISSEWGGGIGLPLAHFIENLPHRFSNRQDLKEHLFSKCPDSSIAQYLSAVAKLNADGSFTFPFEHDALVKTIHLANKAPLEKWTLALTENKIETMFLRGENSRVWLRADYEAQKSRFQSEFIKFQEWENCGHGLPFEKRNEICLFLKHFFVN